MKSSLKVTAVVLAVVVSMFIVTGKFPMLVRALGDWDSSEDWGMFYEYTTTGAEKVSIGSNDEATGDLHLWGDSGSRTQFRFQEEGRTDMWQIQKSYYGDGFGNNTLVFQAFDTGGSGTRLMLLKDNGKTNFGGGAGSLFTGRVNIDQTGGSPGLLFEDRDEQSNQRVYKIGLHNGSLNFEAADNYGASNGNTPLKLSWNGNVCIGDC